MLRRIVDVIQRALESRLAKLKREARRTWFRRRTRLRAILKRAPWRGLTAAVLALAALKVALIISLPFLIYVRASVELYSRGLASWLAVFGGALLTVAFVIAIGAWLSRRYAGRARVQAAVRWVALPITVAWCGFAVFHLSASNAKSEDVRDYFSRLHPVLRVALATAILADESMIVTDLGRVPTDYTRMGLPINDRTKHYRQPNGWVHAVDLRTRDRGEIRNRALQVYFWMMGFDTLRHVGTADHLHVQLAVRD